MRSEPNHAGDQQPLEAQENHEVQDALTSGDEIHDMALWHRDAALGGQDASETREPHEVRAERASSAPTGRHPESSRASVRRHPGGSGPHLLFGSVEDLLDDLRVCGAPDGNIVRVERLVRARVQQYSGTATLGVALTARRRGDEILSAWVIVARVALDPWGQPISRDTARQAGQRHRDVQRTLAAFLADAGFVPRDGLYLLTEECYGYQATAPAMAATADHTSAAGAGDTGDAATSSLEAPERVQLAQEHSTTEIETTGGQPSGDVTDALQGSGDPGDTERGDLGGQGGKENA